MAIFFGNDADFGDRVARQLYDAALDAPGPAGLARMEAVRCASELPQLLALAQEWGVSLSDDADDTSSAASTDNAAHPLCYSSASSRPSSAEASPRRFTPHPPSQRSSRKRQHLEAAKSAAEMMARTWAPRNRPSIDELVNSPREAAHNKQRR